MSPSSWYDAGPGSSPQVVWEDGDRVFCRGWRDGADGDQNTVLVVLPCGEPPTQDSLNRLRHEYGLKDNLDDAWAVRPLELVHERGQTMLVLRDPGGEPLDRLLGPPLEVGRFLHLAVALSGALGRLHQRGLVHKDIKPSNIVVNSSTYQVWLTGFGIASRLPREHQLPEPPEFIAGTLPYMAPEQTGRMNRSIDSRSDLYSLGITFYEMLTGTPAAADPTEWVHCHIARRPAPPDERVAGVPGPLPAIVTKLLAKTAEERFTASSRSAPAFIALTDMGISPCPVMKMIGIGKPTLSSSAWRSRPLNPGNLISSTRQLETFGRLDCNRSFADSNRADRR